MSSHTNQADAAELAMQNRKRKAEQLANNPQLRKVQKQFQIKTEPGEGSGGQNGSGDMQKAVGEAGEDSDDDGDSEDEGTGADEDEDDSGSSSSSDTDADSSSESEDEDVGDPQTSDPRSAAALVQEHPVAQVEVQHDDPISHSAGTSAHSDDSDKRLNFYYDILANLELSDPVVAAAVSCIAEEYFKRVFPAVAVELAKQRSNLGEMLKERQVAQQKADEVMNMILEAQSAKIVAWLKDLGSGSVVLQTAINAAASGQRQEAHGKPKQAEESRDKRATAEPAIKTRASRDAVAPNIAPAAAGPSRLLHAVQPSTKPASPSPSTVTAARSDGPPPSGHRATASEMSSAKSHRDDSKHHLRSAYHLFQHHAEEALARSPSLQPIVNARKRISALWRDLSTEVRETWKTLHARVSQDEALGSGTDLARDLLDKQGVLPALRDTSATGTGAAQNSRSPHHRSPSEVQDVSTNSSSTDAMRGAGRWSADCYRPSR